MLKFKLNDDLYQGLIGRFTRIKTMWDKRKAPMGGDAVVKIRRNHKNSIRASIAALMKDGLVRSNRQVRHDVSKMIGRQVKLHPVDGALSLLKCRGSLKRINKGIYQSTKGAMQ